MQIEGLTAVVTGGASGLGGATAAMLAAAGANVAILDLNEEVGTAHGEAIGAMFIRTDVADEGSVAAALQRTSHAYDVPRLLVNCAGIAPGAKTVDKEGKPHSLAAFRRAIEINLIGTFNVLSQFAAGVSSLDALGEERGVIINTASVAAYDGQIGQAAYAASKAGIVGMTLPIARDLASRQIRVVTIAPGLFLTPLLQGLPQAAQDSLGAQVPHPSRLGKPEEFAQMVGAIISNPMLNGEVLRLDGAIRLAPR